MSRIKKLAIALLTFFSGTGISTAQNPSWFGDVTDQIGGSLLDTVLNFRIYAVDMNNDDYPDLLLEYNNMQLDQLRLFMNVADTNGVNGRKLIEATDSSGINPPNRSADMAAIADFNNDGNVDFITNVWNNQCNNPSLNAISGLRYFAGNGDGTFTMSTSSGLETIPGQMAGSGLPILDFDRDGNLDFFCATQFNYCTNGAGPKYLFKGNGDGTFLNASAGSGISFNNKPLFGANVADWNNDCNQDIITAPYTAVGYGNLFSNNGNTTFTDVASTSGYNVHWLAGDGGQAMVPWEAMPYDYDNDGDIDFLVQEVHGGTGNEGRTSIFTNQGPSNNFILLPELNRMTRVAPQATHKGDHKGIWMDFDNDGLVDVLTGEGGYNMPNERLYFLRQDSTHYFFDITEALGWTTPTTVAPEIRGPHAVEPFDFDLDGDDDIVLGCLYSLIADKRFLILENKIGNQNNWIKIKLVAPAGVNKSCIGARVYVKSGGITQQRDIYAGQGHFGGQQPFAINFGIGSNTVIDTIIVRWPNATCTQAIITDSIPINQTYIIDDLGISPVQHSKWKNDQVLIFPNPLSDETINIETQNIFRGMIEVHNIMGQIVLSVDMNTNQSSKMQLQLGNLSKGTYSIHMSNTNGEVDYGIFIKAD